MTNPGVSAAAPAWDEMYAAPGEPRDAYRPLFEEFGRLTGEDLRARSDARTVFHDVRLAADDIRTIAGVHVSTPERTLVDLARSDDDVDLPLARAWAAADPLVRTSAEAWLARHPRFPHARRAATLLSGVADSHE